MADQITLAELLPQMEACATKMGKKNPTRRVLWIAAQMLVQMAREIQQLREPSVHERGSTNVIIAP